MQVAGQPAATNLCRDARTPFLQSRARPRCRRAEQVIVLAIGGWQQPSPARNCLPCASSPEPRHACTPNSVTSRIHELPTRRCQWLARSAKEDAGSGSSDGGGGTGGSGSGGGGDGGGGGGDDDDEELTAAQAEAAAAAAKVALPADMVATAQQLGLRSSALTRFLALQSAAGVAAGLATRFPAIRDRLIADDKFLFKIWAEVVIDTGCATVAEVRKRGEDFWAEFEFYLSDLVVGVVLDIALVSLMAPRAVLGSRPPPASSSALQRLLSRVPSAVFEASVPGVREYSVGARFACVIVKFLEYSLAGMACGLVGQGVANSLMLLKRHIHGEREGDVAVPPLLRTALVWGLFMGVSSNLRYQVVFGLERLVDLTIAKRVPQVAYASTVAIRFVNNVVGGENFIDMARWAGVQ